MDANQAVLVRQDVTELLEAVGLSTITGRTWHEAMQAAIKRVHELRAAQPEQESALSKALDKRTPKSQMELLDELRRLGRRASGLSIDMTRPQQVEARHWLLYAAQECTSLREWVIRPDMTWTGFIVTLDGVLAQLEALRDYVSGQASAPVHPNELAGAGAPPVGVIMAESNAGRAER